MKMYYNHHRLNGNKNRCCNMFKFKHIYYKQADKRRLFLILIAFFFLTIYFYQMINSSYTNEEILKHIDSEPVEAEFIVNQDNEPEHQQAHQSIIIDALKISQDRDDKQIHLVVREFINGIYLYDMNEPIEQWWPFECVKTKMKHSINTRLCIHEPKFDRHISGQLKENGLWEPVNVRSFLKQLQEIPDANVIDLGANIGLYSLLAAKLNRTAIAVEPLHENLNRIHKAAHLENVQMRIIALVNAVSNERKQVKLKIDDNNIGGSYVLEPELINPNQKFSPISSSVIVNSILLDDLVDVYKTKVLNLNKNASRKFIIKMDIEGYEPFVFEQSRKLFKQLEIVAIFMEFGKMLRKLKQNEANVELNRSYLTKVLNMLSLFKELNFEPYEVNGYNRLDYDKWREWPWDIYLRQCDFIYCPDHVYKLQGA